MPEISRFLGIIIYMYFNEHSPPHFHARYETFAKLHKTHNFVIPAKAGIQYFQIVPGFRVKPGMTNKGVIQRSRYNEYQATIFIESLGILQGNLPSRVLSLVVEPQ